MLTSRHLISFQVDTNWQRKIIESTVQNYTPNSNNSYYVQVQDIIFYAAMLSADMPPANGPHFINFGASECQFQAVTSTTNNLFFNVKPSSNKLTTFIQSSLVGSNTLNPAGYMDASGGFSSTMTLFPRIQFGSVVLPQPDINLYNTNIGTTTGDWSYWKDAYYQTIQANGWSTDELGPESFPTWLMLGPLFSNKFDRDPSDQSTTVMVYCTFSTTPSRNAPNSLLEAASSPPAVRGRITLLRSFGTGKETLIARDAHRPSAQILVLDEFFSSPLKEL